MFETVGITKSDILQKYLIDRRTFYAQTVPVTQYRNAPLARSFVGPESAMAKAIGEAGGKQPDVPGATLETK
jgi:hypothetical protein